LALRGALLLLLLLLLVLLVLVLLLLLGYVMIVTWLLAGRAVREAAACPTWLHRRWCGPQTSAGLWSAG
jgi:hypothetical protein